MYNSSIFRLVLGFVLIFAVFAGMTKVVADSPGRSQAEIQSSGTSAGNLDNQLESLTEDHPCYEAVILITNERYLSTLKYQEPMVIPEDTLGMDSELTYMYILDREYRKGRNLKEIRQAILKQCIANKKL